jgi:hypothetical protein
MLAVSLRRDLLREVPLVAAAILLYFGIRNLTAGSAAAAFENARGLVRLERALQLDWEQSLQSAIAGNDILVTLANWVYIWGHWPVILTTAAVLFLLRRGRYRLLRNAIFVSGAIGFLVFALLPVAPPRLLDLGLVDTVTEQSHAYRALQPPGLTNQYAALPSLHFGWNLLVGIVLVTSSTHLAIRLFGVLSPAAMAYAVVATGNHFVIDVLAGLAAVLVGLAVAGALAQRHAATLDRRDSVAGAETEGRTGPSVAVPRRPPRRQPARRAPRRGRLWDPAGRS